MLLEYIDDRIAAQQDLTTFADWFSEEWPEYAEIFDGILHANICELHALLMEAGSVSGSELETWAHDAKKEMMKTVLGYRYLHPFPLMN